MLHMAKGWLAVRAKIKKWNPVVDDSCAVCEEVNEKDSISHFFLTCNFAIRCWEMCGLRASLADLQSRFADIGSLFLAALEELRGDKLEIVMSVAWAIWRNRNAVIWNASRLSAAQTVFAAQSFVNEWRGARRVPVSKPVRQACNGWHKPAIGTIKINTDAGFSRNSNRTGVGVVARDSNGSILGGMIQCIDGLLAVDEGEAWGVLEAIKWAESCGFREVIFEMDSLRVRDAIYSDGGGVSVFYDFINAIKERRCSIPGYSFVWCCRNANLLAHALARFSVSSEDMYSWVEPPIPVDGLLGLCSIC